MTTTAKLAQLQATADLAAVTLQRDQRQLAAHGVAQATVDSRRGESEGGARSGHRAAGGDGGEDGARPVRRAAGRAAGRCGAVSSPPGTTIVTLQQLDPMFVDFYLPQQALGQIAVGQKVEVTADAYPGQTFAGTISSLNAKVDPTSRMLQVRASVANADGALLPGMYLNVSVATGAAAIAGDHPAGGGGVQSVRLAGLRAA